jgi:ubiquinone/menaquinone biosynthesis C-methylase UbiE
LRRELVALQALDLAPLVIEGDFSESMLREARMKLSERRAPRVRLVACGAFALPFRSRTFGCVMSAFLLRNLEDLSAGRARCGW